jgi:hypothetical protein
LLPLVSQSSPGGANLIGNCLASKLNFGFKAWNHDRVKLS